MQIPFIIYAQSVGPFNSKISRYFVRWLFSRAAFVRVRENISKQELVKIGLNRDKILVVPDAAFALKPSSEEKIKTILEHHDLQPQRFVAVTIRQWYAKGRADVADEYKRYLKEIVKVIDFIVNNLKLKVGIIPHVTGPTQFENDLIPSRQVLDLVRWKDKIVIIDDELSPSQLITLYAQARFLIGTRFHSVIFALITGTPCIAISYFGPKAFGIMQMLGFEKYVLDIKHFKASNLIELLKEIMEKREEIVEYIKAKVTILKKESQRIPVMLIKYCRGIGKE